MTIANKVVIYYLSLLFVKLTCASLPEQLVKTSENYINFFLRQISTLDPRNLEPESRMNTIEIVRYMGFPAETHSVTTEDGYILEMHRIPSNQTQQSSGKLPVIIQHALVCSSAVWVMNSRSQSLGFVLADAGYDVWLGNFRGNTYSRRHKTLNPEKSDFWKFTWDEMASYDLPAMINYVLNQTGHNQLIYIGHSLAVNAAFGLLSTKLEYNDKINTVLALTPPGRLIHVRSILILILTHFHKLLMMISKTFKIYEIFSQNVVTKFVAHHVCRPPIDILCIEVLFLVLGEDWTHFNRTRLPIYLSHLPAGASSFTADHLAQIILSHEFKHYDWGSRKENLARYGQRTPPFYDLEKITTRIALFYGSNDVVVSKENVEDLANTLKNDIGSYEIGTNWSHADFMWAKDVGPFHSKIIEMINLHPY